MRIATAAWPIDYHDSWNSYVSKADRWVAEAASQGANLLLLPEYGSMELTSLVEHGSDLLQSISEMQELFHPFCGVWAKLSDQYAVTIVAPSFPVFREERYFNESWVFGVGGARAHQAKLHMTRFESESWNISPGNGITLLDIDGIRTAIAICYDIEFPDQIEALAAAGTDLVLVPSCTDTDAGFTRVSITARARAIENQCFVVQSSTVGEACWSPSVDTNTGTGGIFGPADIGFPSDGILAQGRYNTPGWTYADLDFDALMKVRENGQVLNRRDHIRSDYALHPLASVRSSA